VDFPARYPGDSRTIAMRIKNPLQALGRLLYNRAPIEAQLIVTRRCNLSCGYCTEYDGHSPEIPFDTLRERIDALHQLGVLNIALLGGEPLLHRRIADVVAHADRQAQVSITTNGFLISDRLIEDLNAAGLANMQVSIDALGTDASRYIQKTLKPLLPKLKRLAERAAFDVHLNVVLCDETREQFEEMLAELRRFPFWMSMNLLHDDRGRVKVGGPSFEAVWNRHYEGGRAISYLERDYGRRLLRGEHPHWRCRAGSRFLYVDEVGHVQYCSAQRGRLDIPLAEYTKMDLRRESRTDKGCEEGCAMLCVYRTSLLDNAPIALARSFLVGVSKGVLGRPTAERPGTVPAASLTSERSPGL
jgi:MoaA/NifB/PqqE/SkfB family radical SAM enzyme